MPQITRRLEFDAAHRVLGHEGKCKYLHGHRYVAEVSVRADKLDSVGRVVDFSVVKILLGGWIDANLDHNVILHAKDPLRKVLSSPDNGRPPFVMPDNPTAENIAALIFLQAAIHLPSPLEVVHVRLYETPNCWADYPG